MRSREMFEAGPEGPARELSKDEILERDLRARFYEYAQKTLWVKTLLKATGKSEEDWVSERVVEEMERIKKGRDSQENEETN